jgi:hypothetical protein
VERPSANEYAPFYQGYISGVPDGDIVDLMRQQVDVLARLPAVVRQDREQFAYAPGKWTVRQVIGHMGDAERIFGYRALRISRGDATPLAGFDENSYVARSTSAARPVGELVDELTLLRRANIHLFDTIDDRSSLMLGTANSNPVSVRALAFIIVGHVRHHLGILHDRYGIDV